MQNARDNLFFKGNNAKCKGIGEVQGEVQGYWGWSSEFAKFMLDEFV